MYGQEIVGSFTTPCAAWETNGGGYLAREPRRRLEGRDKEKYNTWREGERGIGWWRTGVGEGKEDGMKTSIAGACNTAVRTEGSGGAINQAAWKMPDQGRDVSAKTVWNRYSRGSRRTWIKERGRRRKKRGERRERRLVTISLLPPTEVKLRKVDAWIRRNRF